MTTQLADAPPRSVLLDPELASAADRLRVQDAHALVKDLLRPRMAIYWADFLTSWAIGLAAFVLVGTLGYTTVPGAFAFAVSVCALYRAAAFIHELVHMQRKPGFARFRRGWNLLCGIPLLIPYFMYECHWDHHAKRHYGTAEDAEYVPFARRSPWAILGLLAASPLVPLAGPYRFGILTPLSYAIPRLRGYVYAHASALKLDVEYVGRPPETRAERRSWMLQELACLAFLGAVGALVATGTIAPERLVQWYLTFLGITVLNSLRLLGAHRYHGGDEEMTFVEQVLDSTNYPRRRPLAELWAPVGLRLHALHHLLPGLPYHSYQEAHERLAAGLPPDSAYHLTSSPGLLFSLRRLWRDASANHRRRDSGDGSIGIAAGGAS
ncbi:MAG TPA: fatty acid desaturase [Thermoleophilaceae bacterium]|jgi:fatty acid desaturase